MVGCCANGTRECWGTTEERRRRRRGPENPETEISDEISAASERPVRLPTGKRGGWERETVGAKSIVAVRGIPVDADVTAPSPASGTQLGSSPGLPESERRRARPLMQNRCQARWYQK